MSNGSSSAECNTGSQNKGKADDDVERSSLATLHSLASDYRQLSSRQAQLEDYLARLQKEEDALMQAITIKKEQTISTPSAHQHHHPAQTSAQPRLPPIKKMQKSQHQQAIERLEQALLNDDDDVDDDDDSSSASSNIS
jgi:nitrogen fixation/metabolism regulation signal transduction histidine kinase